MVRRARQARGSARAAAPPAGTGHGHRARAGQAGLPEPRHGPAAPDGSCRAPPRFSSARHSAGRAASCARRPRRARARHRPARPGPAVGAARGRCRRALTMGLRAADAVQAGRAGKEINEKMTSLLPFLFDLLLLLLLDLHRSCPLGAPDALPLPSTDVMPALSEQRRADVLSSRGVSAPSGGGFYRAVCGAGGVCRGCAGAVPGSARRCRRSGVAPPPRRAGPGRGDARGRRRGSARPAPTFCTSGVAGYRPL